MAIPRFAIIGTGRSGSGYISKVLREAGVLCGHEDYWGPRHRRRHEGLAGDSSWFATFGIDDSYPGWIYHQIRHPLQVISSLANGELTPGTDNNYYRERIKHFTVTGDPVTDAVRCYIAFYERAEKIADDTWRLEDIDEYLIRAIADSVGYNITWDDAHRAVSVVPRDFNKHHDGPQLTLEDLPESQDLIHEIATRWSYSLS